MHHPPILLLYSAPCATSFQLSANYQEFLGKAHMINVPWVFNSLWYIIKGFIEPRLD
jgi:CRAL/TRIO domain